MVSTAFGPHFADAAAAIPQINGTWLIDLRTLCAVLGVVLFGTWWVAKWMQKVEDRLKSGEVRFTALEMKAQNREELLVGIKNQVDRLVRSDDRETERNRND